MVVTETQCSYEYGCYRSLEVTLTDPEGTVTDTFSVHDGEPEDNNLGRNFSDCWGISAMLKAAHAAGVRGEKFEVVRVEEEDDEG